MSFADWEMLHQGQTLDPILQAISDFLDNNSTIVDAVQRDLQRGLKNPGTGRNGLTAQQVLRALILKRVKNWDLRELRERIADGISLRQFTDFYSRTVPEHQRFNHAFNRLTPKTVKIVNDLVVKAAVELGLEDGSKLRTDTTVVQTNIHHPTDNTLLWDAVRVVTRSVARLFDAIGRRVAACKKSSA
jgi:transposase, IS5 family